MRQPIKYLLSAIGMLVLLGSLAACVVVPAAPSSTGVPAPTAATALRDYTTSTGETVAIPVAPQRIVAQDFLGELLVLGVKPVGTPSRFYEESTLFLDQLAGVENIGAANSFDLEKVVALNPDLILVNQYLPEELLARLVEIAPVIPLDDNAEVFTRLTTIASIVGKEAEAQAWIDQYAQQQAATREALADVVQPGEKALILNLWEDIIWVQATRSIGQTIYNTVGFSPTAKIEAEVAAIMRCDNTSGQSGYLEISLELLPDYAADADRIFLLVSTDEKSQSVFDGYTRNPLWNTLPAVQNDKVYLLTTEWGWYNPVGLAWELENVVKVLHPTP